LKFIKEIFIKALFFFLAALSVTNVLMAKDILIERGKVVQVSGSAIEDECKSLFVKVFAHKFTNPSTVSINNYSELFEEKNSFNRLNYYDQLYQMQKIEGPVKIKKYCLVRVVPNLMNNLINLSVEISLVD
jgi:hypothetical protein